MNLEEAKKDFLTLLDHSYSVREAIRKVCGVSGEFEKPSPYTSTLHIPPQEDLWEILREKADLQNRLKVSEEEREKYKKAYQEAKQESGNKEKELQEVLSVLNQMQEKIDIQEAQNQQAASLISYERNENDRLSEECAGLKSKNKKLSAEYASLKKKYKNMEYYCAQVSNELASLKKILASDKGMNK